MKATFRELARGVLRRFPRRKTMNHSIRNALTVILVTVAFSLPALSAGNGCPRVVNGEVLELQQGVSDSDGRMWDEAIVQGNDGRQYRLRLQQTGDGPALCSAGDRIRARIMTGDPEDGAYLARNMFNHTSGEMFRVRDSGGNTVRLADRTRERKRDGSCAGDAVRARSRERVHSPGTGGGGSGGRGGGRR
jgi:hypothetical protein